MAEHKTKKLINSIDACVDQSLDGLVATQPGLRLLQGHRVVIREDIEEVKREGKVALLSGGGSGHEPAHAGFVGRGMLSGAIAGSVFTSPPPQTILAAIRAVGKNNPAGTLLIVKNYTGDRLNFGLAAERATAEGLRVDMVVVSDDCALTSSDKTAGRRGLCGTILIHKIAGALAEEGKTLQEIVQTVRMASQAMGTIGICLYPCSLPGAGPSFRLGPQEFELGLGIHGEAGVKRMQLSNADEVVKVMIDHMISPSNQSHLLVKSGDQVAIVINNLGGTSYLELGIVARAVLKYLENMGVSVKRSYCGTLMTSLEMAGVSLTIMHLDSDGVRARCLDDFTTAPAWPRASISGSTGLELNHLPPLHTDPEETALITTQGKDARVSEAEFHTVTAALKAACDSLAASEDRLNELDRGSGDGDCGTTMKNGAQGVTTLLSEIAEPVSPSLLALKLSSIAETDMGGSSGALYSLFFTAAAAALGSDTTPAGWVNALKCGMDAISKYGGASVGDRTMLDSMHAALTTLQGSQGDTTHQGVMQAAKASQAMAEATAKMDAKAGRASYVNKDQLTKPDPGAMAVAIWMTAVATALQAK